jgi:hypothetical protein
MLATGISKAQKVKTKKVRFISVPHLDQIDKARQHVEFRCRLADAPQVTYRPLPVSMPDQLVISTRPSHLDRDVTSSDDRVHPDEPMNEADALEYGETKAHRFIDCATKVPR